VVWYDLRIMNDSLGEKGSITWPEPDFKPELCPNFLNQPRNYGVKQWPLNLRYVPWAGPISSQSLPCLTHNLEARQPPLKSRHRLKQSDPAIVSPSSPPRADLSSTILPSSCLLDAQMAHGAAHCPAREVSSSAMWLWLAARLLKYGAGHEM
jgi:hypothetical protein